MELTPFTEQLLQVFIVLAGVLFLAVGIGLIVILFKLSFLIHSVSDLVRLVSYEMLPLLKELRSLATQLQEMGGRASSGVKNISNTLNQAGPMLKESLYRIKTGTAAFVSGLGRTFEKS